MRNSIARHDLVELVRTDKTESQRGKRRRERLPTRSRSFSQRHAMMPGTTLPQIRLGRVYIDRSVQSRGEKLKELGIGLLDFRFKRINYNPAVAGKIFERMTSERRQIAERFRSEGAGRSCKIIGQRGRDLHEIDSEAYRKCRLCRAKRTPRPRDLRGGIYQSPEARILRLFAGHGAYRTSFRAKRRRF